MNLAVLTRLFGRARPIAPCVNARTATSTLRLPGLECLNDNLNHRSSSSGVSIFHNHYGHSLRPSGYRTSNRPRSRSRRWTMPAPLPNDHEQC